MKEQKSKQFVKEFISTEIPTVFMATHYMWKLLKVWKLDIHWRGQGSPSLQAQQAGSFETLLCTRGVTP